MLSVVEFRVGRTVSPGGRLVPRWFRHVTSSGENTGALPSVEVVITNPGGFGGTVAGGYTYVVTAPDLPLSITAISPDHGIVDGGTPVKLIGSGLDASTQLSVGGVAVKAFAYLGVLYFQVPAHQAGRVDVVVSNASGESLTAPGAFTYVLPESLILDGIWEGWSDGQTHVPFEFTIANNALTSVTCGAAAPVIISPPVPIVQAQLSVEQNGIPVMAARFLSNENASGAIGIGTCREPWSAAKREPGR